MGSRLISLTLFPLHFFFHPKLQCFRNRCLYSNDLMHAGILRTFGRTIGETTRHCYRPSATRGIRWLPFMAILMCGIVDATGGHFVAKNPSLPLTSLPLFCSELLLFWDVLCVETTQESLKSGLKASKSSTAREENRVGKDAFYAGRCDQSWGALYHSLLCWLFELAYFLRRHSRS